MPRLHALPAGTPSARARGSRSRRSAWRQAFRIAATAAAAAIAAATGAAEPPRVEIDLRQAGRTFVVDATFTAPVPLAVAWDVLTDFEHMDAFVPNLADSRIVARDGNRLTILQHGVARFGPLAMRFESERLVTLAPPATIQSTQVRGSMEKLDSTTTFAPEGPDTRLTYHVEAIPGALYPDFVARRFLRHEIAEQFDAIVREMVRRHATAATPSRRVARYPRGWRGCAGVGAAAGGCGAGCEGDPSGLGVAPSGRNGVVPSGRMGGGGTTGGTTVGGRPAGGRCTGG